LILDRQNHVLRSPVNGVSSFDGANKGFFFLILSRWLVSQQLLVFFLSPGREFVVGKFERTILLVASIDLGILLDEQFTSEVILLFGVKGESKNAHVVAEVNLKLFFGSITVN
jgi:hypothetical protein